MRSGGYARGDAPRQTSYRGVMRLAAAVLGAALLGVELEQGYLPVGELQLRELADTSSPGADTGEVSRRLRQVSSGFRGCYERALVRDPNLQGVLTLRFAVGPRGRVSEASVEGLAAAPAVGACIALRVRSVVFPAGAWSRSFAARFDAAPRR